MAFAAGTRFGSYEVVEPIGSGGMGEVWRAKDTELGRAVAIKVLPQAFLDDTDRLARFRREAEFLAALNHPNIATIYGLEQAGDQTVFVMELVEGPTLADRISEGPIPPDEAMGIALQIVAALEAAHDKQIVHRDLKPANVKIRDDGMVKVLDFGISKPIDPTAISGGTAVATTPAMTQAGVILGTAAYMSPEQARGKFVDQRTDIWAFGCLLFEMLTGQPAFGGEDVMLTLARVLANETNLDSIPGTISPAVRHTIRLCLEKDPRNRIHHVGDVRLALNGTFESELPETGQTPAPQTISRRLLPLAATVVVTAVIVAAIAGALRPPSDSGAGPVRRFTFELPAGQTFSRGFDRNAVAVEPSGSGFVYAALGGLYWRPMDSLESTLIPGTDVREVNTPFFLPGGDEIGFGGAVSRMNRIPFEGGVPEAVDFSLRGQGIVTPRVEADGSIFVNHDGGISMADELGGELRQIIELDPQLTSNGAHLLPDGDTVLFAELDPAIGVDSAEIVAQSMSTGERTELIPRAYDPRYLTTGHLLFARDGAIWARAFDPDSLSFSGDARQILSNVAIPGQSRRADYDVAADGTLVYVRDTGLTGAIDINAPYVWVYFDGRVEALPFADSDQFFWPKISPNGARLAVAKGGGGDGLQIWVYEFDRPDAPIRLTSDGGGKPVWTPDGRSIVYMLQDPTDGTVSILRVAADGSAEPELLWQSPDYVDDIFPYWIDDEQMELLFNMFSLDMFRGGTATNADVLLVDSGTYRLKLEAGATPERVLDEPGVAEGQPTVSPSGQNLAYAQATMGIGEQEIYIRPYPDVDAGRSPPITAAGGIEPFWSPDGQTLYYLATDSNRVMAVDIELEPEFRRGVPVAITGPEAPLPSGFFVPSFDIDFDQERVLIRRAEDAPERDSPDTIVIVENWTEELTRLVPTD